MKVIMVGFSRTEASAMGDKGIPHVDRRKY